MIDQYLFAVILLGLAAGTLLLFLLLMTDQTEQDDRAEKRKDKHDDAEDP